MEVNLDRSILAPVIGTVRYPLVLVDVRGRIEVASHAASDLFTVSLESIRDRSIDEITGSCGPLLGEAVASVIASGKSRTLEIRSGGRNFDIVMDPVMAKTGQVTGAIIHATERPSEPPEDSLRLVLDQLPHAVYWKDRQSRYLGGNRIFAEVVGLSSSRAVPGITDYDIMARADADAVRREDEQVLRTGQPLITLDQSLALTTGGTVIEKMKAPLMSASGEIIGILCFARDITEQKRAEAKLVKAKLTAERKDRAKTSFLAAASHDLRQPVQALALFAKLLDNRVTEPSSKNLVRLIQTSVLSLANLLDAVIHLSKLDAGVIEPTIRMTPAGDLLKRLGEEFAPQAAEKRLDLIIVDTNIEMNTDPMLLERILRNLISNAIRYTERGRVLVGCRRQGTTANIEVWDTGIGIPADQFGEIFQEFHRSHKKTHRAIEGFGIGLSIVERLTTLLGHRIEVSSKPGKGTVFRIGGIPCRTHLESAGRRRPPSAKL
jgi:PAS domain S-box-containing protein